PTSPPTIHHLYIRPHAANPKSKTAPSSSEYPSGRTLFVSNVPVDATRAHFVRLFRRAGWVERVAFDRRGVSGSSAHVVFEDSDAIGRVEGMVERRRVWSCERVLEGGEEGEEEEAEAGRELEETTLVGLAKYLTHHLTSRPLLKEHSKTVDATLAEFESAEEQARLAAERLRNVPDADGFVTVTRARGRRNTNIDASGATMSAARPEEVRASGKKKLELVDFYRFQMRESKRN
ncbi:ribosomal RNA-processing protein 7-domain-containing protein, partial [Blyttiomyces helicus]